jgi:hypothetical protein
MSTPSTTPGFITLLNGIGKFNGQNWTTFKKDVEVYFSIDGYWDVITNPKPTDTAAAVVWDTMDKRAYSFLYFLIEPIYQSIIIDSSSGTAAWKALKAEYEKDSCAARLSFRHQFYNIHHDPSKPVSIFIDEVQSIARQLTSISRPPGKDEVEDIILLRLDTSFEAIRSSLITRATSPSLTEIISAIKQFEINQRVSYSSFASPPIKTEVNDAMAAFHRGRSQKPHKIRGIIPMSDTSVYGPVANSDREFDWGNTKDTPGACFRCGTPGHVAANCVHDMPSAIKFKIVSAKPNQINHSANVAEISDDDYAFLGLVENVALTASEDSGSAPTIPTATRRVRTKRNSSFKETTSQEEYRF